MSYHPVANTSQWIKITKTYQDFSTSGLSNDISIYTLPQRGIVQSVVVIPTTTFSGGAIASYTISVGKAGDFSNFLNPANVFTGATYSIGGSIKLPSISGTTDIRAEAISTGADLDEATQGSVDIYLFVSTLP